MATQEAVRIFRGSIKIKVMYYREKIIDGILYCKNTPNGVWVKVSDKAMTERVIRLEKKLKELAYE